MQFQKIQNLNLLIERNTFFYNLINYEFMVFPYFQNCFNKIRRRKKFPQ